jgi:hypothetical protein
MPVDAPQIATPQSDAMPIEEFKNMDGNLASAADTVAKLSSRELPVRLRRCEAVDDFDNLTQFHAQEEVIVGDLMHFPHAARELQKPPDFRFRLGQYFGDIPHPGWMVSF